MPAVYPTGRRHRTPVKWKLTASASRWITEQLDAIYGSAERDTRERP